MAITKRSQKRLVYGQPSLPSQTFFCCLWHRVLRHTIDWLAAAADHYLLCSRPESSLSGRLACRQVTKEKPGPAILRGHEYYEFVADLAAGAFGFVQKARDKETNDLVSSSGMPFELLTTGLVADHK